MNSGKKLKRSGSFSDDPEGGSEAIPILPDSSLSPSKRPFNTKFFFHTPITVTKTVLPSSADPELSLLSSLSSPQLGDSDPASHDKIYYDDRYNSSVFDPFLALAALPRITVSIGGMLLTGYILSIIITWDVFKQVPELFILIPVLLNLRGILEQSLIGRLSNATSFSVMDSLTGRRKIWFGNFNLLMFQSITAGCLASLMAAGLAFIFDESGVVLWRVVLMVIVSAATTASASITSGVFLFVLLQFLRRLKTPWVSLIGPITSTVGSVSALLLLSVNAGFFFLWTGSWVGILFIFGLLVASSIFFYSRALRNEAVSALTSEGWPTMLFSLLITGMSGLLLQRFINKYSSLFVLVLPVFNGVSGNAAGIYCAEFLSHLHLFQLNSLLPRKTAFTLLILSNPIQLSLIGLISYFNSNSISLNLRFVLIYLIFANVCVLVLMALADGLIKLFWHLRVKPDSHIGPLQSTLGDLLATLVLVTAFYFLESTLSLPESNTSTSNPVEIINQIVEAAAQNDAPTLTETLTRVAEQTVNL